MRGRRRGAGDMVRKFAVGAFGAAACALVSLFCLAGVASAAATVSVTPNTDLTGGQSVSVGASGYPPDTSLMALLECNVTPGEPTVAFEGNQVPIGCTSPTAHLIVTGISGGALTSPVSFSVVS